MRRGWIAGAGIIAMVFGAFVGSAQAATAISTLLVPGNNLFEDNDFEQLVDVGGSTPGVVDVGDRIRGVAEIQQVNGTSIGSGTTFNELTVVYTAEVVGKFTFGQAMPGGGTCQQAFCFLFAATSAANFLADTGVAQGTAGTVFRVFEDPAQNFNADATQTVAQGFASASGGTSFANIGFTAAPDGVGGEFFVAGLASDSIAAINALVFPSPGAPFGFALNQEPGGTAPTFSNVPCTTDSGINDPTNTVSSVAFCGHGQIQSKTGLPGGTQFDVATDVDITTFLAVPAPSALLLLGSGLLGVWGVSGARRIFRRR